MNILYYDIYYGWARDCNIVEREYKVQHMVIKSIKKKKKTR